MLYNLPTMNNPLFRTQVFPVEGSDKIACVTAGWRGKIAGYENLIQTLNKRGFTVIGYEHSPLVLISGNPQRGVALLDEICNDFAQQAASYKKIICVGASAGAGLGLALQRRMPAIQYGVYAGAGEPGKDVLERPLFYFLRKKFNKRGFSASKVRSLWQELDISPDNPPKQNVPFVIVLGKRDKIVRYEKALAALQAWQKAGAPIKIITKPNLGHRGVIAWHKEHIEELLNEAEQLTA